MQSVKILLDTVEKVRGFVNTVGPMDGDVDIVSDRYVVDAKSIMGIFSLDLSKPLNLNILDDATAERLIPLIQAYIV